MIRGFSYISDIYHFDLRGVLNNLKSRILGSHYLASAGRFRDGSCTR